MRKLLLGLVVVPMFAIGCNAKKADNENPHPITISVSLKGSDSQDPSTIKIDRQLIDACSKTDKNSFISCVNDLLDNTKPWLIGRTDGTLASVKDDLIMNGSFVDSNNYLMGSNFTWDAATKIPSDAGGLIPSTPPESTYHECLNSTDKCQTASTPFTIPSVQSDKASFFVEFRLGYVKDGSYITKCEATNLPANISIDVTGAAKPGCMLQITNYSQK